MTKPPQDDWEVSPLERLDEAFALLRTLPMSAVAWWLAGSTPMVLGWLFFLTDLNLGGSPVLPVEIWALALAAAYTWMKVTQAWFSRLAWARLLPKGGLPGLNAREWFRRTAAFMAISVVSLPAMVMAVPLLIPIGWVFAYFHHATALCFTHSFGPHPLREMARLSGRLAIHDSLGHYLSVILLLVLAGMVWAAVTALGVGLPFLVRGLTGVESDFTRNPLASTANLLYLTATVSVAWMVISPYFRMYYVLRTFQVQSRHTGDDLLSRFQAARRPLRSAAVAMMLVAGLALTGGAGRAAPTDANPPASEAAVSPVSRDAAAEFGTAIRHTLEARQYQWRLPLAAENEAGREHPVWAMAKRALRMVGDVFRGIDRWAGKLDKLLRRWLGGGGPVSPAGAGGETGAVGDAIRGLMILVVAALVIGGLVLLVSRSRRKSRQPPAAASPVGGAAPIDLSDAATLASALPEDEWLRLARDQWQAGDLRLAVRAVFLATLAALGDQGVVAIARSKSNRDYLTEVRLRAATRREALDLFGRSVTIFERAWYGWHRTAPEWVEEMLENHHRLASRGPAI